MLHDTGMMALMISLMFYGRDIVIVTLPVCPHGARIEPTFYYGTHMNAHGNVSRVIFDNCSYIINFLCFVDVSVYVCFQRTYTHTN